MKAAGSSTSRPVDKPRDSGESRSADSAKDKGQKKAAAFSKVLERKSTASGNQPDPAAAFSGPATAAGMLPVSLLTQQSQEASAVSGPSRQIDQLAGDIVNALQVSNLGEVQIQLDSSAFGGGLQVRLAKQNGKLAVELHAKNSEVAKLLAQNAETLAHRLESRGYPGASIQIRNSSAAAQQPRRQDAENRDQQQQGQNQKDRRRQ
jgi:flagellar hook-length control protein FliK